jgi:hypothetical protein
VGGAIQMSVLKNYEIFKKPYLEVRENDLSKNESIANKTEISIEDIRPDIRSKECLRQGFVVFPVLRDQPVYPLQLGAKYCDYEVKNYGGGVIEIIQNYGKQFPNPSNEMFPKLFIDREINPPISYYFRHNGTQYVHVNSYEEWLTYKEEIEAIKRNDDLAMIIKNFYGFISKYVTNGGFKISKKLEKTTFNYKEVLAHFGEMYHHVQNTAKDYYEMLYIFGDINDVTYEFAMNQIVRISQTYRVATKTIKENIIETKYHETYDAKKAYVESAKIGANALTESIFDMFFKEGYLVGETVKEPIPNLGEIYYVIQLKERHETFYSRQAMKKEMMGKAKPNELTIIYRDGSSNAYKN